MKEKTKKIKSHLPNLVFIGCLLVGAGVGFLFGRLLGGLLMGIGIGMIARAILMDRK